MLELSRGGKETFMDFKGFFIPKILPKILGAEGMGSGNHPAGGPPNIAATPATPPLNGVRDTVSVRYPPLDSGSIAQEVKDIVKSVMLTKQTQDPSVNGKSTLAELGAPKIKGVPSVPKVLTERMVALASSSKTFEGILAS